MRDIRRATRNDENTRIEAMRRREFLGTALAAGLAGAVPASAGPMAVKSPLRPTAFATLPSEIAGMSLVELRDDYRNRLFNEYLPFWENGGIDRQYGGIMCELNADGTVADGLKNSWYQGRGLWVYSFLYNHFGQDRRWLEVADGFVSSSVSTCMPAMANGICTLGHL